MDGSRRDLVGEEAVGDGDDEGLDIGAPAGDLYITIRADGRVLATLPYGAVLTITERAATNVNGLRMGTPDARPVGAEGVAQLGHREYVGGRWHEIGKLQFEFLRDQILHDVRNLR